MAPPPPDRPFPSLRIAGDALTPNGPFAELQARYLEPDRRAVAAVDAALAEGRLGVVAHFYMDAELQGVLAACRHPLVFVADSLAMADRAVAMAEAGARAIVVLGVDFMAESVRATLDAAGHAALPVYRVIEGPIGCSLAAAAETPEYLDYLTRAAASPRALHVIYVNTSLRTKAEAEARVPTITCTSSNVVATLLQAAAQIEDVRPWFGPDTYMGENLAHLFGALARSPAETVRRLHPGHTPESVGALARRFELFRRGTCIVHHLFGREIVAKVRRGYEDALVTAHLEVPGEMFSLALEAEARGRGVVGSTSNILDFVVRKTREATSRGTRAELTVVLGTESGMITALVREVRRALAEAPTPEARRSAVEIVFPVAEDLASPLAESGVPVVPGSPAGDGCSTSGGCATCPYMKQNSLEALEGLLRRLRTESREALGAFEPRRDTGAVAGTTRSVAELARVPIVRMRAFQRTGALPDELVRDVLTRHA